MSKVKFAIIGCGNIGKRHLAVVDAESNAKLVAICDLDIEKCKNNSSLYNVPYYTDYKEMLDKHEVEIVNIATPHGTHKTISVDVLKRKINVLVEKPMALSVEDCNTMIEAAEANAVKLFVVKQNRFNKPIALVKEAMDSKRLGKIFMVQCNVMWNRHDGYYKDSSWLGNKELEGGVLQTQVSHFIDLLVWWFGDIEEAKTIMDTLNHNIEIEDCGVSALKFDTGVLGSLFWTTCVYNVNYEGSITIIGEKGTIKIGGKYLNKIEFWDVQSFPLPEDVVFEDKPNNYGKYQGTSSNHDKVIAEISSKLLQERPNVVEGNEGMKTVSNIEKIYNGQ